MFVPLPPDSLPGFRCLQDFHGPCQAEPPENRRSTKYKPALGFSRKHCTLLENVVGSQPEDLSPFPLPGCQHGSGGGISLAVRIGGKNGFGLAGHGADGLFRIPHGYSSLAVTACRAGKMQKGTPLTYGQGRSPTRYHPVQPPGAALMAGNGASRPALNSFQAGDSGSSYTRNSPTGSQRPPALCVARGAEQERGTFVKSSSFTDRKKCQVCNFLAHYTISIP